MKRSIVYTIATGLLAACAEGPVAPAPDAALDVEPSFTHSTGTTTVTYDFQDLPPDCRNDAFPEEYRGLTFAAKPYFALCGGSSPPLPTGSRVMTPTTVRRQTMILPGRAVHVQMQGMWYNEWWNSGVHPPHVEARDGAGNLIGTMTWPRRNTYRRYYLETKWLSGHDIATLTFVADHREFLTTYIRVTYSDPTEKEHCWKGGWESFGFANQGQCVRFIETGKDSR